MSSTPTAAPARSAAAASPRSTPTGLRLAEEFKDRFIKEKAKSETMTKNLANVKKIFEDNSALQKEMVDKMTVSIEEYKKDLKQASDSEKAIYKRQKDEEMAELERGKDDEIAELKRQVEAEKYRNSVQGEHHEGNVEGLKHRVQDLERQRDDAKKDLDAERKARDEYKTRSDALLVQLRVQCAVTAGKFESLVMRFTETESTLAQLSGEHQRLVESNEPRLQSRPLPTIEGPHAQQYNNLELDNSAPEHGHDDFSPFRIPTTLSPLPSPSAPPAGQQAIRDLDTVKAMVDGTLITFDSLSAVVQQALKNWIVTVKQADSWHGRATAARTTCVQCFGGTCYKNLEEEDVACSQCVRLYHFCIRRIETTMVLFPLSTLDRSGVNSDEVAYWMLPTTQKRKSLFQYDTRPKRTKRLQAAAATR